ncbi:MAG: hypothetical protein LM556_01110 [Desulfurococcaceae archaeon]|jgi:predicted phosphoribosyltransferase|nr:hypothetical protein [Desulfurococcaceae archaeon]
MRIIVNSEFEELVYVFSDRLDAGVKLANWLRSLSVKGDLVYAIPAGGVPVGYVVAKTLHTKLDILVCPDLLPRS